MKRSLHLFMLRGGVFICIVTLLLTSCENFLKAGEIKAEIEESIEIANSKPILYHIIADKDSGTVSPSQATLKKKQSVNLLFTPAEGCTFIRWEVRDRSSGELVPDAIKFDNPKDPETKALIVRPRENLMICPKCTLVPAVIQITPAFESGGCDQDTAIEIIFNKAVDTLTFDFDNISITSAEDTELFSTDPDYSFFDMPYFSEDNKVLTIPTIKGKFLLLPDGADEGTTTFNSKKNRDDITVYLDLYGVKDCDGLDFMQCDSHTYRVNKTVDNVAPEIQDIIIYSTSDTKDCFFKELTNKKYSDWVNKYPGVSTYKFYNGDFTRNHVSRLYITLWAYDAKSAIKNIRVKETYTRTTEDVEVTPASTSVQTFTEGDFEAEIVDDGVTYCTLDYEFDTNNVNDGLYKIEVSILDTAYNESQTEEYWVIKDTVSNPNLNIMSGRPGYSQWQTTDNLKNAIEYPEYNSENGNYELEYKFGGYTDSNSFYKIYLNSNDTYFSKGGKDYLSYRNITGIIEEEGEAPVVFMDDYFSYNPDINLGKTITNKLKNYKRNTRKNTKIKFIVKEESGVAMEFSQTFLKSVDFLGFDNNSPICSNMAETYEGETIYPITLVKYQANEEAEAVEYNPYVSYPATNNGPDGIYTYYVYRKCGAFYSSLGRPYKYYKGVQGGNVSVEFPSISKLPDYSKGEIIYERNSKTAKFNIELSYNENTSRDYTYSVFLDNTGVIGKYLFENAVSNPNLFNVEVPSNDWYVISLLAFDDNGNFVKKSDSMGIIELYDEDNTPPKIQSKFPLDTTGALENYVESNVFRSNNLFPVGYAKNVDDDLIPKAYFYFLPSSFQGDFEDIKDYPSIEVLISSEDKTKGYIDIPFNGLTYGEYRIVTLVYDESQNYSVQRCDGKLYYYTAATVPKFNGLTNKLQICSSPLTGEICKEFSVNISDYTCYTSIRTLQNDKWVDSIIRNEATLVTPNPEKPEITYWNYEYDYPAVDSFIKVCGLYNYERNSSNNPITMQPAYAYTGYYQYLAGGGSANAYCKSKTWMPVANGWQIFADRPAFVHTLYCSKNLTQTGNFTTAEAALEWETRAQETGIIYNDGTGITFSYTDENLAGIPEDYYYTTICHFADGTVVMSEVKLKD